MAKRLDFSTQYHIRELENIIRDRSKRIVYNKRSHVFEAIAMQDSLSHEQTEDKEILQEKIQGLAGTIHLRIEDVKIILKALRDRIKKELVRKSWWSNLSCKRYNVRRLDSLETYEFFEKILSQIVHQATEKVTKSSKNLFMENRIFNSRFLKLKDFKQALSSYIEHIPKKEIQNDTRKVQVVFNNISHVQMLNSISEDLYLLSKEDVLVYENFRKCLLNDNFPKRQFFSEKEPNNIFEYNPSVEELSMDIKAFLKESFYDFSFILKLLFRISLTKGGENFDFLSNATDSAKIQWFLHKIQLISQNESEIFFNMIASTLSPIKKILEQPSLLKQEKIKQNLQEDIIILRKKITDLKSLSYSYWKICMLNLFEEWIFDNQELLKITLDDSFEEEKAFSFLRFFKDFFKK